MTDATKAPTGEAVSEIELRLRWRQTQPEREAHFSATVPTLTDPVGYICLVEPGEWSWALTADDYEISRNCGPTFGTERSARHAAKCVEDAWFAATKGTRHDRPPAKVNAYAAARHRYEAA